jgi:hypothetical protein
VHVPKSEKRVVDWFGITEAEMPTIMIADMTGVSFFSLFIALSASIITILTLQFTAM